MPRWMIVVGVDRTELHAKLRWAFARAPWVEVVLERRGSERRRHDVAPELDGRMGDRRTKPDDPLRRATHRFAYRGEGFKVYEAVGPAPARCPECQLNVWFEMPRFAEPPGRLVLDVEHETVRPRLARHFVELSAFAAAGRPLLSSRIGARTSGEPLHES